jgi:hypothetical protein
MSLAEHLGLAASTVNRWALGEARVPRYAVAYLDERRELDALKAKFRAAQEYLARYRSLTTC